MADGRRPKRIPQEPHSVEEADVYNSLALHTFNFWGGDPFSNSCVFKHIVDVNLHINIQTFIASPLE